MIINQICIYMQVQPSFLPRVHGGDFSKQYFSGVTLADAFHTPAWRQYVRSVGNERFAIMRDTDDYMNTGIMAGYKTKKAPVIDDDVTPSMSDTVQLIQTIRNTTENSWNTSLTCGDVNALLL